MNEDEVCEGMNGVSGFFLEESGGLTANLPTLLTTTFILLYRRKETFISVSSTAVIYKKP
jgi:hypothetical protein